jgi:hypothetical protein
MALRSNHDVLRFVCSFGFGLAITACDSLPPQSEPSRTKGSAALTALRTVSTSGDTYIRNGSPNQNQGSEPILRLQSSGGNRALLFFDTTAIQTVVATDTLLSATLEVTIDTAASNWGPTGRPIAVHRLLQASAEYGATWNCAQDTSIENSQPNCSAAAGTVWSMDASDPAARPWQQTPIATATITNGQVGIVSFDVTADVAAILSGTWAGHGFLIKKVNESESGQVELVSRERGPAPRLVLAVEVADAGGGGGAPDGGLDAGTQSQRLVASKDSHVRQGEPNHNFGLSETMRLQASGRNRALVDFDVVAVSAALGTSQLRGARIELTIAETYDNWGADRSIGAHRLRHPWTELGATWNCSEDANPGNSTDSDCVSTWAMWAPNLPQEQIAWVDPPTSTTLISSDQTGVVTLDVTRDLACALAGHVPFYGFIVKKEAENQSGRIDFTSRETATPPALVIEYGSGTGVSVTAEQCTGVGTPDGGVPDGGTCTPSGVDDDCDGEDDDCDARADEAYVVTETTCGVGACVATGERSCVNGAEVVGCTPGTPASSDTSCDGVDDDCNGSADDGYAPTVTSCGIGACAAQGSTSCVSGTVVASCTPGAAESDANCDGVDDDCNGTPDDEYPFSCTAACQQLRMAASDAVDDSETFAEPNTLVVPLLARATAGPATGALTLTYEDDGEQPIACTYRGDGGIQYVLETCDNGLKAGDAVASRSLHVQLESGGAAQTTVQISLESCGGKFGLLEELPIPDTLEYGTNSELLIDTGLKHLIVMLKPGTTRDALAATLAAVNGRLVGALKEVGLVVVMFDGPVDAPRLAASLEQLLGSSIVAAASHDFLMGPTNVPEERNLAREDEQGNAYLTGGTLAIRDKSGVPHSFSGYRWTLAQPSDVLEIDGTWGLRYMRAPIAWNLNPQLSTTQAVTPVEVAVVDVAFRIHADLGVPTGSAYAPLRRALGDAAPIFELKSNGRFINEPYRGAPALDDDPAGQGAHGTSVAGIIGAQWGNRAYLDGVTPFVHISGYRNTDAIGSVLVPSRLTTYIASVEATYESAIKQANSARVVNISLGFVWGEACRDLDLDGDKDEFCDPRLLADGGLDAGPNGIPNVCAVVRDKINTAVNESGQVFAAFVAGLNPPPGDDDDFTARRVLVVTSAGNDNGVCGMNGFPSRVGSPAKNAALRHPDGNVLVAEALAVTNGTVGRAPYSDVTTAQDVDPEFNMVATSLLAPGGQAAFGIPGLERIANGTEDGASAIVDHFGTSFAAPHVVGAAAHLLALCPGLKNSDLRELLVLKAPKRGFAPTASTAVLDLANAVRELSEMTDAENDTPEEWQQARRCVLGQRAGSLPSLKRALADMNDGTPDGFTKAKLDPVLQRLGIDFAPEYTAPQTLVEAADQRVDMRDFRRFRDIYLMSNGPSDAINWGDEDSGRNPARDVNGNGVVRTGVTCDCEPHQFCDAVELKCRSVGSGTSFGAACDPDKDCNAVSEAFSRALLAAPRRPIEDDLTKVPAVSMSDLDVLVSAYEAAPPATEDVNAMWGKADLPRLLHSADLIIRPQAWLNSILSFETFYLKIDGVDPDHPNPNDPIAQAERTVLRLIPLQDVTEFVITTPLTKQVTVEIVDETGANIYGPLFNDLDLPLPPNQVFDLRPGEDRLIELNPHCAILSHPASSALPLFPGAEGDSNPQPYYTELDCPDPGGGPGGGGSGSGGSGGSGSAGEGGPGGGGGCLIPCAPDQVCVDGVCRVPPAGGQGGGGPIVGGQGGGGGSSGSGGSGGNGGDGAPCPGLASDPTCDGVDDDCDGAIDENYERTETTCGGLGACASTGITICVNGEVLDTCQPGQQADDDASCDGRDDDCNGSNDEDYSSVDTSCGLGDCVSSGSTSCVNGAVRDNCEPRPPPAGGDANCDGRDQDCDGSADQDYEPEESTCGCATVPTSCEGGAVNNNCSHPPPDATCDGNDDNCSGAADEDFVPIPLACDCGSAVRICVNGSLEGSCAGCPGKSRSSGDPHMQTFDGLAYELQQVGEFVYSSDGGDFVVQARTAPTRGSSVVSSNIAIATYVAGDRVGYYLGRNEPLLVNGAPAAVPAGGLTLTHGGRVVRTSSGYEIQWPSGELTTMSMHAGVINVAVTTPDRTRSYMGLLGTWNGIARDDLVPRGASPLPWPQSQTNVYRLFSDSWRVSQAESLFDYGPGEDTSTFTDMSFPSHRVTVHTLPTEDFNQAHEACVAAGVDDATEIENCILDVAATEGDTALAQAAADTDLPPPVEQVRFDGYFQDFQGADDGQWSPSPRFEMPALDSLVPTRTLGLIAGGQTVQFVLAGLPSHADVSVAFDTHIVGPWAGEAFEASADGFAFTTTGFSNTAAPQAFPDQLLAGEHPAQTAALAAGSLATSSRAIYHHSYTFAHSDSELTLTFVAPFLPEGAAFALDNLAVVTGAVGDPWDPKCTPNGPSLDDHNPCTLDLCNPTVGPVHSPRPAGTSCSDDNLCNGEETCNGAGACRAVPPVLNDGNPCTDDACDPVLGVTHIPSATGTLCADADHCDGVEACDGLGACQAGTPLDPATLPPDTTCDGNDDDCNGVDDEDYVVTTTSCGQGACANTGERLCVNGHQVNTCQPLFAEDHDIVCDAIDDDCDGDTDEDYQPTCVGSDVTACVNGAEQMHSCADSAICTNDSCSAGVCVHAPVNCDDGNQCTVDRCDAGLGCGSEVQPGLACNDGDLCTAGDACDAVGVCAASTTVNPNDNNACTLDSCHPQTGVSHTPLTGAACDDGNHCSTGDACTASGTCAPSGTLQCDDGQFCNGLESCDPNTGCVSSTSPTLSDGVTCTVDACDEVADAITHTPDDAACDDESDCTTDTCDLTSDCQNTALPDGTVCDDDDPTLGHLICTASECVPEVLSEIERISIGWTPEGASIQGNGDSVVGRFGSNEDGSIVAFHTFATSFASGDTNSEREVFIYDRNADVLTLISRSLTGGVPNGGSRVATITPDGRYVAYHSAASNLVPGDTNGWLDCFVYDRQTGVTELVSVSSNELQGNNESAFPAISADGRYVAFTTAATNTNLVPGDTNSQQDVVVRDRLLGTTERVSVSSSGAQGNGFTDFVTDISLDGRYVVFVSRSTNLVSGDTNGLQDTFVRDRTLGITTRVSVSSSGVQANAASFQPALAGDGRYVTFTTSASNLVAGPVGAVENVYVHDMQTGTTTLITRGLNGSVPNANSTQPVMSADGRYVSFQTVASNLFAGDTNGFVDMIVHDRLTGATAPILAANGALPNNHTSIASISRDGRRIAFIAAATNLVAGDTNGFIDTFSAPNPLW